MSIWIWIIIVLVVVVIVWSLSKKNKNNYSVTRASGGSFLDKVKGCFGCGRKKQEW